MTRLTIGVHAAKRDAMVAALHEAGVVELRPIVDEAPLRELVTPPSPPRSPVIPPDIAAARSRIERAVEILATVTPEKNPVVALLSPHQTKK
ncbi:hypothetical protein [Methanogenium cariaci]|uniref:hypothetical protein n=1 Tax=Methanogenium cariaci TaxID=2197 RepID=UPI0007848636|nr:hypothetical protein [Methanogenium cariaci]